MTNYASKKKVSILIGQFLFLRFQGNLLGLQLWPHFLCNLEEDFSANLVPRSSRFFI